MKVIVHLERNVSDAVEIEVKDLDELKELAKDTDKLHQEIDRQDQTWEEVCGEVLYATYEVEELGKTFTEKELTGNSDEDD